MKKQLLLGSVLLTAMSAFSQHRVQPKATGLVNMRAVTEAKYADNGHAAPSAGAPSATTPKNPKSNAKTNSNTWHNFTSSMNIYGVVISYTKPLHWNDELNAVTFVHRKSPTYSANGSTSNSESGTIVAMISTDCGENWDSTLVFADQTHRGRYPQGGIYNPPGNTDISNAHIVSTGPVTHGSGWVGNFYSSKPLGTANYNDNLPSDMQYFSATGPYPPNLGRHDFTAYAFTATDDGKMRALAGITDDGLTADTAVMLVTGTFNSSSNAFDWEGHVFDPPTTVSSDGTENWLSRPMMAWNETGTVGYVVIMGSRLGATGSNVGFQPIVYKTTNSGATWSLENGINFNAQEYDALKNRLWGTNADSNMVVPNFYWVEGIDCAVDRNNKLHIFTSINAHPIDHPDSLNYVSQFTTERYRWPHVDGFHPYLYDFVYDGTATSWSHKLIDSMATEGIAAATAGAGYQDNPWNPDPANSNQKVRVDARIQISRSFDGRYLLYSWTESDTSFTDNQKKWNNLPNIKTKLYDVLSDTMSSYKVDVTEVAAGEIANRAMYHFISPKFKVETATPQGWTVRIPMTISNSNPYDQVGPNTHWYSCASIDFERPFTVGIASHSKGSVDNSLIYPNPAKGNATVRIHLNNSSKVQVEVMNTIGQVVKTMSAQGQAGTNEVNVDLGGLSSGIYLVNVKVDNASSTKKLVIE
jgi:hypothetical protein